MEFILAIIALVIVMNAHLHRRRAKKVGEPVGSLWYHIRQSWREGKEKRRKKKQEKENARIDKANAAQMLRAASEVESKDRTVQPPSGRLKKSSRNKHNVISKKNFAEAKKVAKTIAPLDEIQFSYRDKNGAYTDRRVSVRAVDSQYLEGHCHMRHGTRTFIIRNIRGKLTSLLTGEISKSSTWARQMQCHPDNRPIIFASSSQSYKERVTKSEWKIAAYFAGFHYVRRKQLEALAKNAGWQVRTGFSKSLDIMVAGALTGSVQMEQAELGGIETITEQEFRERMTR